VPGGGEIVVLSVQVLANIDVENLSVATAFYCSALGLTVRRRFGDSAVELVGGSCAIYLLEKAAGTPATASSDLRRAYSRHWTPVHLDFVVPEIQSAVTRACSAGARLEGEIATHAWGHIALLADPFGHGFCLIEFLASGYDEIAT